MKPKNTLREHLTIEQRLNLFCKGAPFILRNVVKRLMFRFGNITTQSGTYHSQATLEESVAYIRQVFSDYKHYGGIERFYGKVAEVGTGDSCGVGILFLSDGCEQVDLIDKYYSTRHKQHQDNIIKALIESSAGVIRTTPYNGLIGEEHIEGLSRFYGSQASSEQFFTDHRKYDFIVSRAVFEHVDHPEQSLIRMIDALNPHGMLLHKVDLRDHGLFTPQRHELTFLQVPQWYYRLMTHGSGKPNRVLMHRYQHILEQSGLDYTFFVTRLVGVGDIIPHKPWEGIDKTLRDKSLHIIKKMKPSFAKEFQLCDERFLAISGFFMIAKTVKRNEHKQ